MMTGVTFSSQSCYFKASENGLRDPTKEKKKGKKPSRHFLGIGQEHQILNSLQNDNHGITAVYPKQEPPGSWGTRRVRFGHPHSKVRKLPKNVK